MLQVQISCVMSATSSLVALRRASLISERVRDLLEDLPDPVLCPLRTLGLEGHSRMGSQALAWYSQVGR